MNRHNSAALVLLLQALLVPLQSAWPASDDADDPSKAARQFQNLLEEYDQEGGARVFAKRFLALADAYPSDTVAVDALLWVVEHVRGRKDTDSALQLLVDKYTRSERLTEGCDHIAQSRSTLAEPLLRMLAEKSPHESVRAHACYYLAALLDRESNIVEQLKAQPESAPRVIQYYGQEYGQHLTSLDLTKLEKEREAVYQRMLESFPNSEIDDEILADFATRKLFRIRRLSVGKVAPDIQGEDIGGQPMRLSDFRGKVVMLTFWGHW